MEGFLQFGTAVFSAAVAAVTGFGIGSFLTPALSMTLPVKAAVALVAIPHFLATACRLWLLRRDLDRSVFWRFGLASAAGGLLGAWAQTVFTSRWLSVVLGVLLLLAGFSGFWSPRVRLRGPAAWLGGVLSGAFGGLVGNQGGIRAAALLAFDLPKSSFVAVSTASALLVDLTRLPFYLTESGGDIRAHLPLVAMLCAGVLLGTWMGMAFLGRIPEKKFRAVLSVFLVLLGGWMITKGLTG